MRSAAVATALTLFTICSVGSAAAERLSGREQRGLTFATANCARCHAIGKVGDSPLKDAPPFRTLHERYAIDDLAEPLAEGIRTGHPSMPEWVLEPDQIDNLIAYIKRIQD